MAKSYAQRRSRLQERRIADDVGGRVQAGSGSSWRAKSDVRKMGDLRSEAKFTTKLTYPVKLDELLKIRKEAINGGLETPVMQIEFANGAHGFCLAVMDFRLFNHWYGFSQKKPLHLQDCATSAKQFTLDLPSAKGFFQGAHSLGALGVIRLSFEDEHFAILEWDLFTTLHEEYLP